MGMQISLFFPDTQETRTRVPRESDPCSQEFETEDVASHLEDRFIRYFRLGAQLQYISQRTGVPRDEIVRAGPSQYQDRSSGRGHTIHAAHVIRVGEVNPDIGEYFDFLKKFVGHTHNVDRLANLGIGRDFDNIQEDNLSELAKIDFNYTGSPSEAEAVIIRKIQKAFLEALKHRIESTNLPEDFKSMLSKAHDAIEAYIPDFVFQSAYAGVQYVKERCEFEVFDFDSLF